MCCTGVGATVALGVVLVIRAETSAMLWAGALALPALALAGAAGALWASGSELWRLTATLVLRYLDVLAWAGRYAAT
jgi:hypothetical protein